MPFPVWSRTSASFGAGAITSQSIILPTFIQGDMFVLMAGASGGGPYEGIPNGFTELLNISASGGTTTAIAYRIMQTGDNRTASFAQSGSARQLIIAYKFDSGSYVGVPEVSSTSAGTAISRNPPAATASWNQNNNSDTLWVTFVSRGSRPVVVFPDGISDTFDYANQTVGALIRKTLGHFYNRESRIDPTEFIFDQSSTALAGTWMVRGTPFTGSYMLTNITGSGRSVMSFRLDGAGRVTVK